jgi:octaprenyl-diphosphate synthase
MHLGTAYQIYDDVADLLGDEGAIGKTLGTDLASGKFTLPLLLLLETRGETDRADFAKKLATMSAAQLGALLSGTDIVARVRKAFDAQVDAALEAIAPFQTQPAAEPLRALAAYVRGLMARY